MDNLPKQSILVDLDVILDTRIGTVVKISEDAAKNALLNGYITRTYDAFDGVQESLYRDLYSRRDIETLRRSQMTAMVPLLKLITDQLNQQASVYKYHTGASITINTFPYSIDKQSAEYIASCLLEWLRNPTQVGIVSIPPEGLTPSYLKDYSLVIKYDYEKWLNLHQKEMEKNKLTDVTFYFPAIFFVKNHTKEEIEAITKECMHPFNAIEQIYSLLFGISLIDVKYFSIVSPEALEVIDKGAIERIKSFVSKQNRQY